MSWFSSPLQLPTFPGAIGDPELGKGRMMLLSRLGPCKTRKWGLGSGDGLSVPCPSGAAGVSWPHVHCWEVSMEAELCHGQSTREESGVAGKGCGSSGRH